MRSVLANLLVMIIFISPNFPLGFHVSQSVRMVIVLFLQFNVASSDWSHLGEAIEC
jgi:hypothetical protein